MRASAALPSHVSCTCTASPQRSARRSPRVGVPCAHGEHAVVSGDVQDDGAGMSPSGGGVGAGGDGIADDLANNLLASSESRARPHWASASRMMARARPEAVSSDSSRRLAAGVRGPGRCWWVRTGRGAVPASYLAAVPKPDHPPLNATTVGRTLALRWVPQSHGSCDLHAAQAVTVGPPRLRWRQGRSEAQGGNRAWMTTSSGSASRTGASGAVSAEAPCRQVRPL